MLSYQHGYHAGNFADVVKHITLTRLITYMVSKDKPLFYLETHSGKGLYDLHDKQAKKTAEARQGIELLWPQRRTLPSIFAPYLEQIEKINPDHSLRYYPGSPLLALNLLRQQDRLVMCELHPSEFKCLQQLSPLNKHVYFSHSDGLENLKAYLPPPERRGLIFLDPSYEIKTDYIEVPKAILSAYKRFETGVYCVWYPIIDNKSHTQLLRGLKKIDANNNLRVEFYFTNTNNRALQKLATETADSSCTVVNFPKKSNPGMTGCGLWIINPPYLLQTELKIALDILRTLLNPGISSYLIKNEE